MSLLAFIRHFEPAKQILSLPGTKQSRLCHCELYLSLRAFICHCELLFVIARYEAISLLLLASAGRRDRRAALAMTTLSCHCEARSNLSFVVGQRWKERSPRSARDDNTILSLRGTKQSLLCHCEVRSNLAFGLASAGRRDRHAALAMTRRWLRRQREKERSPRCARDDRIA